MISQNSAGRGAGIFVADGATGEGHVVNSVIAGNTSTVDGPDVYGEFISYGHNLIGNGAGSDGWDENELGDLVGDEFDAIDPLLNPLGYYGGTTMTLTLQSGSPAIDAGDNTYASSIDQRGLTRIVNSTVDIGAVEMQSGETSLSAPYAYNVTFNVALGNTLTVTDDDDNPNLLDYSGNTEVEEAEVFKVNGEETDVGEEIETTNGGLLTIFANGDFTYIAPDDYVGDDSATYTISDGVNTRTGTITFRITNTTALDASFSVLKNDTLTVTADPQGLLHFGHAVSGDAITVTKINGSSGNVGTGITTAEGGSLTVQSTGAFVYIPDTNFTGEDTFTFTISDGLSESTATVTIHVVKVLTLDASFDVDEDDSLEVPDYEGLLTFAEDAESDPLDVVAIDGDEGAIGNAITTAMGGTLTVEADGSFDYEPAANFYGLDWFYFTVSDGTETSTSIAVIDVAAVNDAPVITLPTTIATTEDTPIVFSTTHGTAISVADADIGSGILSVELFTAEGTLTLSGSTGLTFAEGDSASMNFDGEDIIMNFSGTLANIIAALNGMIYTPGTNYDHENTINLEVWDGEADGWDTREITIHSVNDAPTGSDNSVNTGENTDYVFSTSDFGYTDVDGNEFLAVKITSLPSMGTLYWYNGITWAAVSANQFISASDIASGYLKYTPPANTTGSPTFTFRVQDDGGTANSGIDLDLTDRTMTINILEPI